MVENASWDHLRSIFDAAAQLSFEERNAFLDRELGSDIELRLRVDALLGAHDAAASLLASRSGAKEVERAPGSILGTQVGPYRLLEKLGEGGFGVVFLAEQRTPFQRKVALKLLRADANSAQVLARFDAERQALALMKHPNIASAHDAGATAAGQPYFVMEYIAGLPITQFADDRQLSIEERLQLFLQLCDAVQHAHQRGVIHRDLKPSNVLVAMVDDKPQVKVIDFGVAKAIGARLTDQTLHTQLGMLIGTPEYMSPEQAEGSTGGIDTRSDVYSLGVILYELLTGALPIDRRKLRDVALAEMFRRIREEEPPKLSTKVQSLGADAQAVAERRRTDPSTLCRRLRGDLEWITVKALEKEPSRRYGGVGALADDIEGTLTNRPISAHPPSAAYQLRKFAARRKGWVAFVSTVFVLLVAATISLSVLYGQQREERAKADGINRFLQDMLMAASPYAGQGKDVLVRDVLDRAVADSDSSLSDLPKVRSAVQLTLARTYESLGMYDEEEQLVRSAAATLAIDPGKDSEEYQEALFELGIALWRGGRFDSSAVVLEECIRQSPNPKRTRDAVTELAGVYQDLGRPAEAESTYVQAIELFRKSGTEKDEVYGNALIGLAIVLQSQARYAEAESLYRGGLEVHRAALGNDHTYIYQDMNNLGSILRVRGKKAESESLFLASLAGRQRLLGEHHPDVATTLNNLGLLYKTTNRLAEAESCYTRALAIYREAFPGDQSVKAMSMNNLGMLYHQEGRFDDAEPLLRDALAMRQRLVGEEHPQVALGLFNLSNVLYAKGRTKEGNELLESALAMRRKLLPPAHPDVVKTVHVLAERLLKEDNIARADSVLTAMQATLAESPPEDASLACLNDCFLAETRSRQGREKEADSLFVKNLPPVLESDAARSRKDHFLEVASEAAGRCGQDQRAGELRAERIKLASR